MNKKRIIAGLAAMSLALSAVLTGCGSTGTGGKAESTEDLTWYTVGSTAKDLDMVSEEVSKLVKEKIGVGVKIYQVPNAEYTRKLQTMINSGEEFDICFAQNGQLLPYADNARKGAFVEVTETMLKNQGKDMYDLIPHKVFEQAKVDGKLYGVPNYKEIAWQYVWLVNVPVAEKYGIDYKNELTTLEDMEPVLQKVKDGEPEDTFRVLMPWSTGLINVLPIERVGNTPFVIKFDPNDPSKIDTKLYNLYETEEAKQHLATMRNYYNKGFLSKDVGASTTEAEKTGRWFLNLQSYQPEYEKSDSAAKGYKVDIVSRHTPVMSGTAGSMNVIPVTSKRPEKAMEFLNVLNTNEQVRTMVSYGIKDVHYTLNDQGKRVMTEQGRTNYGNLPHYALGNLFLTGISENDADDKWDKFQTYNDSAVESPLLGFYFDSQPVKSEMAALDGVINQYEKDLLFGRVDPDTVLPEFVSKMKAAGSDKILAEMQKQYDEFLKTKNK